MSLEAKFNVNNPINTHEKHKEYFCVLCAFLWLTLLCGGAAAQSFIDDLQQRSFRYFWEQADPQTGLVPDRARMDGSPLPSSHQNVASIAATGFGLTSLCIAADRRWITQAEALERTRNTLRFFDTQAFHQRGWFYHWLDARTGERRWNSEVSSIDTALARRRPRCASVFAKIATIVQRATRIYNRVDFRWMLNGHALLLSHGWKPESGFLRARWDTYSEDTILYLLAIGSPTYPISPASWYAFGAIVIATRVTATSRPSACPYSCTSTHTRGSTIETAARQKVIASTIFKTPSPRRSRIAPSA